MSSPTFFLLLKCYFCFMIWKLCRSFPAKIQKATHWGKKANADWLSSDVMLKMVLYYRVLSMKTGQKPWALHCMKAGHLLPSAYRLSLTAFWEYNHPLLPLLIVRWKASQAALSNYGDLLLLLFCHPYISCFTCCRSCTDNAWLMTAL